MLRKDIDKLFTLKVSEYISKGYFIHANTMGGSQGEEAKVDLYKDKEVIRVLMDTKYNNGTQKFIITVGKAPYRKNGYSYPTDIIWNQNLTPIETLEFYKVDNNYFATEDEYKVIQEKRMNRVGNHNNDTYKQFDDRAKKIVLPFMKRQPKCKSVKLKDIQTVYKKKVQYSPKDVSVGYYVTVRNCTYKLE